MTRLRGSRKFCQKGFNYEFFFLFDEGRKDQYITISGPSSLNGVSLAGR